MTPAEIEVKINDLVGAAFEPDSENALTAEDIRAAFLEYLEMRQQDLGGSPDLAKEPHWNLIAADYDSQRAALFVTGYFEGSSVLFVAGRGKAEQVRAFAQDDFPDDPRQVIAQLRSQFGLIGQQVSIHRADFDAWISR